MALVALSLVFFPLLRSSTGSVAFKKPTLITLALLLLGVLALSGYLYMCVGAPRALLHYWALEKESAAITAAVKRIKNPQQLINELSKSVSNHPQSAKGWYLLGQLYMGQQQYAKAETVLQEAYRLQQENSIYLTAYAQASFFANHKRLKRHLKKLLLVLLQRQPTNVAAINILAINAYEQKQYQVAVNYWERLIPLFQPGSQNSKVLLSMIAEAQRKLGSK